MVNAYCDVDFYNNVYKGDALQEEEALKWLCKASDAVNRATRFKIGDQLENLTEFQNERVKYAVCISADFFSSLGDSNLSSTVTGYSIGDVSLQLSEGESACIATYGLPQRAYDELVVTGLLYVGVR